MDGRSKWYAGEPAEVVWRHGNDPEPFHTSIGERRNGGWKVPDPADPWRMTYVSDRDCRRITRLAAVGVPADQEAQK